MDAHCFSMTTIDLDLPGKPYENRVVVAMSGGVDSSVVAALLSEAGYVVVGITLQLYDHGAATARKGACCAGQDIHDARRVAAQLGIPHYVLDYEQRFRSAVIDAFAESYVAGETPVPCISCNQRIKFADLLETARDLGAAALATGHYVQSRRGAGGFDLYAARDQSRDQSWFLFATTRAQLDVLRFPLGGMRKDEVRAHAHRFGLNIADKPDSQDICFVPSGRYAGIIERLRPEASAPGDIVHVDGRKLGRHDGVARYTIGQRRGLRIASAEPLYVVRIDAKRREVVVGPRAALATSRLSLRDVNWIGDGPIETKDGLEILVRIRSNQPPRAAILEAAAGEVGVTLMDDEFGVSPGQACVFYTPDDTQLRVLGGGFIAQVEDRAAVFGVNTRANVGKISA